MNPRTDLRLKITKILKEDKEEIEKRKNNINSNYTLAKLDILAIDNYTDSVETLEKILVELNNLQERITERNVNR